MSNVIEPVRSKKTGKVLTNVQICKMTYKQLCNLRDGVGATTSSEREKMEDDFFRICGGSSRANETMDWLKQINDEPDEERAQRLIERTLLPIDLKPQTNEQVAQPKKRK